jgi:small subunit ribosomal protein S17
MARRVLQGEVVCATSDKTISVRVVRRFVHPVYGKTVRRQRNYAVHDPQNGCKVGDLVSIQECAPHSKTKTFELVRLQENC